MVHSMQKEDIGDMQRISQIYEGLCVKRVMKFKKSAITY